MKKLLLLFLVLMLVAGAFAFFFYQMERNELLHAREELSNRYYPIENQALTLSDEAAGLSAQLGMFRPLEAPLLAGIAEDKQRLLREERAESKRALLQQLYIKVNTFAENLERYPDLFRDGEFLKKVNNLKTALEQLRLSAQRYNDSAAAYNQRLHRLFTGLVARGEQLSAPWPPLTMPEKAAAATASPKPRAAGRS